MLSKKEIVLNVATKLFAEQGFENTSVAKICEEASVSKGLVYHHFKTKDDILRQIFSDATNRMIAISNSADIVLKPKQQITTLIKNIFSQLKVDKLYFQLNLNIMLQPSTRTILKDLIIIRSKHILDKTKSLFDSLDVSQNDIRSYMFIAEIDGIALNYLTVFEDYPLEAIKNHLILKYSK